MENKNIETWKPIWGYEGLYEISTFGRVKSMKNGKERIIKQNKLPSGYLQIALLKNGNRKTYYIHRLVASAFIPNDNLFYTQVNHIDENKENNRVENLEWCDAQYNVTYNGLNKRRKNHLGEGGHTKKALAMMERKRQHHEEIKQHYNPNLTDKENLKVLEEYGVKCSLRTLKNFRKDNGISKYKQHTKSNENYMKQLISELPQGLELINDLVTNVCALMYSIARNEINEGGVFSMPFTAITNVLNLKITEVSVAIAYLRSKGYFERIKRGEKGKASVYKCCF